MTKSLKLIFLLVISALLSACPPDPDGGSLKDAASNVQALGTVVVSGTSND